jgi:hypothetical protein
MLSGKVRKGGMMMDFDEARRQLERTAEYNRREQQKIYATAKQKLNELANYLEKNLLAGYVLLNASENLVFVVNSGAPPHGEQHCSFSFSYDGGDADQCYFFGGGAGPYRCSYESMVKSVLSLLTSKGALQKLR